MHLLSHVAYLDAGTGSLIIQAVVGVVAGIGVFGRRMIANVRQKLATVFGRNTSDKKAAK